MRLDPHATTARPPSTRLWRWVAAVEIALAAAAVILDLLLPTLVIVVLAALSLLIRRAGPSTFGFHRVSRAWRLALLMLVFAGAWSLVQLGLLIPLTNHISGTKQDMSDFADLEGNVGMLLGMLVLAWTLAAVAEEFAFRGFLNTRLTEVLGGSTVALVVAVGLSSALFGAMHTEQGVVGMIAAGIDAVMYSVLRYKFGTMWAPVLAHGFIDTIGFVSFFFVGPTYGWW